MTRAEKRKHPNGAYGCVTRRQGRMAGEQAQGLMGELETGGCGIPLKQGESLRACVRWIDRMSKINQNKSNTIL